MFDSQKQGMNLAIEGLSKATFIIGEKKFKIYLEEDTGKETILLSTILAFQEDSSLQRSKIEAYDSFYFGSKRYKKPLFLVASLFIFSNSKTKQDKNEVTEKMFELFDVQDKRAFSTTVKEFENLHQNRLVNVSKQVVNIYNEFYGFSNAIILKILVFATYHHFDFDIEIDVSWDYNFSDIEEVPNVSFNRS